MSAPRTPRADDDLFHIWRYIARDNVDAADALLDDLEDAFEILCENPMVGRDRASEMNTPGLRTFPHRTYLIVYRFSPDHDFLILRIYHSAQNFRDMEFSD